MSRVLVTGAYGLLGVELVPALKMAGHEVLCQGRGDYAEFQADLSLEKEVLALLRQAQPDAVVNLAAATNVDACESDPRMAYLANVRIVENLAHVLPKTGVHLVQISTDHVYDGTGPHQEVNGCPCNVYALSKYAGEMAAAACGAMILRTNFVGRSRCPGRSAFSDWIVQSLRAGKSMTLFDDVLFSALHVSELCRFICLVIDRRQPGIFNVGSREGASKAQFASELAKHLGLDLSQATIGRLADHKSLARRPLDMRMDVTKFEREFGVLSPTMAETIKRVSGDYHND
ncbi:MAG: SDR family oxidoreductase [Desulfurivibrio sp.]|nr:SDR family oxidoreductase [Desulfurivibrio sp.]